MPKLAFATGKTFNEERQKSVKARRSFNKGITAEYKKHHKILNNDFHHLFTTGIPFGGAR